MLGSRSRDQKSHLSRCNQPLLEMSKNPIYAQSRAGSMKPLRILKELLFADEKRQREKSQPCNICHRSLSKFSDEIYERSEAEAQRRNSAMKVCSSNLSIFMEKIHAQE
jgi:hypothetical protein